MFVKPLLEKLQAVFRKYPAVKLVYFFGSQIEGRTGPLSDYDFAIYFDPKISQVECSKIKYELNTVLSSVLQANQIDIVVLNDDLDLLLKYNIIRYGKLIYQIEPYKILVEPAIYNSYFDFQVFAKHHDL